MFVLTSGKVWLKHEMMDYIGKTVISNSQKAAYFTELPHAGFCVRLHPHSSSSKIKLDGVPGGLKSFAVDA